MTPLPIAPSPSDRPEWMGLDIETTITDGKPDAHLKCNRPVLMEVIWPYDTATESVWRSVQCEFHSFIHGPTHGTIPRRPKVIFGHNLAFDLLHLLHKYPRQSEVGLTDHVRYWVNDPGVILWDTMIVEYLLSGCGTRMPSLDKTAAANHVPSVKNPTITQCFAEGLGADEIMETLSGNKLLREYLHVDVRTAIAIGKSQMRRVKEKGLLGVVTAQLGSLKLAINEQFNGLTVDYRALRTVERRCRAEVVQADVLLPALLRSVHARVPEIARWSKEVNFNSSTQLAAILYGGRITFEDRIPVGIFKTGARVGQARYRIRKIAVDFPVLVGSSMAPSVSERALSMASHQTASPQVRDFIKSLLDLRSASKILSTYVEGLQNHAAVSKDLKVHMDLNLAVTNTGRKSSSNPNGQNLPPSIRECIVPPAAYEIVTADWKQLEVIGLAYCSGDPQLILDLRAGRDIHAEVGKTAYNSSNLTDVQRTNTKRVVFGRLYGGGPVTLSAQSGVAIGLVKKICAALDRRYPVAAAFGTKVAAELQAIATPVPSAHSYQVYSAMYRLPTARRLYYETIEGEFSYTQCKNRPIQSFATADIMGATEQAVVQLLWRIDPFGSCVKPLISVHDEIVFAVAREYVKYFIRMLQTLETTVPAILNRQMGLLEAKEGKFDLPLKLEIGAGPNWESAKHSPQP